MEENTYTFMDILKAAAEDEQWDAPVETREMLYILPDSILYM